MKKSMLRRVSNRVLAACARFAPGATSLRPLLHKLRGVRISGRVFIGDDVYIENEYPECVELNDGAQICLRSILIAHTRGPGRIVIGKDAFIGANCVLTAPPARTLHVGEGAVVMSGSAVAANVPPHTLVGTQTVRALATVTVPLTINTPYDVFLAGLKPMMRRSKAATPDAGQRRTTAQPDG